MALVPLQVVGESSIYPSVIEVSQMVRGSAWLTPGAGTSSVGAVSAALGVLQETHLASEFTDGLAAVGTLTMTGFVPAGAMLLRTRLFVPAGFAGDVSCSLIVGDGSDTDRYLTGTPSVFATAATGVECGLVSGAKLQIARVQPVLTITSNADITPVIAGAGSVQVSIYYIATL